MKLTSPKTLEIVQFILDNKNFTQLEISEKLNISIGQVNKVINFLLEKNLVQKNKRNYFLKDRLNLLRAISLFSENEDISYLKNTPGKKLIKLAIKGDFDTINKILNPSQHTEKKLNITLIGFGSMGKAHYRVIHKFPNLNLKAVCDIKPLNLPDHINYYNNFYELLNNEILDAVVIATPSKTHKEIVDEAMKHDLFIMCESPATSSLQEFKQIMGYNKLFLGTTEDFNPAILSLKQLISSEQIKYLELYRQGPLPFEKKQGTALQNLGIHEMFFISQLFPKFEEKVSFSDSRGYIYRILMKTDDTLININIDWKTSNKKRLYVIGCEDKTIEADLVQQEIKVLHGTKRNKEYSYEEQIKGIYAGKIEFINVDKKEPLVNQYEAFLQFMEGKFKQDKQAYLNALGLLYDFH